MKYHPLCGWIFIVSLVCGGKRNVRDTDDLENMTVGAFCERPPHLLPARVILSGAKRSRNLSEQLASEDQTTGDVVWNLGREGTIPCEMRLLALHAVASRRGRSICFPRDPPQLPVGAPCAMLGFRLRYASLKMTQGSRSARVFTKKSYGRWAKSVYVHNLFIIIWYTVE